MSYAILDTFLCLKIVFNVHLLFKFSEEFCILSGNLILGVFCLDCTLGNRNLILLPVDLSSRSFSHNKIFAPYYSTEFSGVSDVFLSWQVFLALQSLPWLYLYLEYLNHQFPFFLKFSWDAKRISNQQGSCAAKRGCKCKSIQEPLGDTMFEAEQVPSDR